MLMPRFSSKNVTLTVASWKPHIAEIYVAEEGTKMPTPVREPLPSGWSTLLDDLESRESPSA